MSVVEQFNPHSASHPLAQVCWSSSSILQAIYHNYSSRTYNTLNVIAKTVLLSVGTFAKYLHFFVILKLWV